MIWLSSPAACVERIMNHEECLAYDAIDKGWGIMSCGNAYVKLRVGLKSFFNLFLY